MSNLLTVQFWFNQSPGPLINSSRYILLGSIGFFILAALIAFFLKKRRDFYQPFWGKLMISFIANAIIGVLLYFFSQQMIPFLSARLWFLLWGIGFAAWMILIIAYVKQLPAKRKKFLAEREYQKYIP
ncbi:MAG TPA: hypothetical protein VMC41_03425 [Candidatus Nanoarchaeia archaeon]|nr:hypothetical protein [Candidatus Nanoarchaeia archaeon]